MKMEMYRKKKNKREKNESGNVAKEENKTNMKVEMKENKKTRKRNENGNAKKKKRGEILKEENKEKK